MDKKLMGKSVVIIGATGGLGSGFAKMFAHRGAKLLLVARDEEKLKLVADHIIGDITITTVDITEIESVKRLMAFTKSWSESVDIVVNAAGYDVRKSLEAHSIEDIQNTLDINLLGTIFITKSFLPYMKDEKGSTIVNIGGFADGRMAFPYYSVDVASRAGVYTFTEAINRELKLEGKKTRVAFFSPSPTDTDAERPFHPLWKEMNISIVPVEKVAKELLKTIEKKKTVGIMGGTMTIVFAKLNSVMPKLADRVMMRYYGRILRQFLYGGEEVTTQKPDKKMSSVLNKIAILLVILSFIFYGMIFLVPFMPCTLSEKAMSVSGLVATGEITWWVGVAIVGKQAVTKYRKYLNPCKWLECK